jgi:hypothetical protein
MVPQAGMREENSHCSMVNCHSSFSDALRRGILKKEDN